MANTWGESGTTWGQGDWGQQNVTTVHPTGFSITSTLGDAQSYPEEGWGRSTWGSDDWGDFSLTFVPTGYSMTGSVGELAAASEQGWGRSTWGNEPWGDSNSPVVSVTGFSITSSLGTLAYAAAEEGWGRDEWGYGNWGQNTTTVIVDGFEMSGAMGLAGWGRDTWGHGVWGEESILTVEIGEPLTGLAITGSLGTPTLNYDFIFTLSDSLLLTASRGVLSINNGADHTQGLGGIAATMSLGTPEVADVVFGPSSFLATMSVDDVTVGELQLVPLTGIGGTMSQGSLGSIPDMARGLTGIAITGSVGSFTITDMQIGLSGIEMTGDLGSGGVAPLHYKDVDITGNTSYTYVKHAGEI